MDFKNQLCLPLRYKWEDLVSGDGGNFTYYLIPGFLVIRPIKDWETGNIVNPGESFWVRSRWLDWYMNELKPEDYPYDDFNGKQYWYDRAYLGLTHRNQRPHCPVCGRECKFEKPSHGYTRYCSKQCTFDPNSERMKKIIPLISESIRAAWRDPNSTFNSHEYRQSLSDAMYKRWADPNDYLNSEEFRLLLSESSSKNMIKQWADKDSWFNSEERSKLQSEVMKYTMKVIYEQPELYENFHKLREEFYKSGGAYGLMWNYPDWYNIGGSPRYESGYLDSAKGGNARYMSSYEKYFINLLDLDPDVVSFKTQPLAIKYKKSDGSIHRYIPDFLIYFASGDIQLIEIKPKKLLNYKDNPLKFKIGKAYADNNNIKWAVVTEDHLCPKPKGTLLYGPVN